MTALFAMASFDHYYNALIDNKSCKKFNEIYMKERMFSIVIKKRSSIVQSSRTENMYTSGRST